MEKIKQLKCGANGDGFTFNLEEVEDSYESKELDNYIQQIADLLKIPSSNSFDPQSASIAIQELMQKNYEPTFYFENKDYVCSECSGEKWIANKFWDNNDKAWYDCPDIVYWCHDCHQEIEIKEKS